MNIYYRLFTLQIIYIARNPKDIATSFFRLIQWMGGFNRIGYTFDIFVDTFVNGTGKFHFIISKMNLIAQVLMSLAKGYT
jgi:hypothetical protein